MQYVNYVYKRLTVQVTKVKNEDYYRQNAIKGCHGQTPESQAGTSQGKLTNTKLLAPSLA